MNNFVDSHIAYVSNQNRLLHSVFELIQMAQDSIVLQMYLFLANGHTTTVGKLAGAFPEAQTIADWLIQKKKYSPHVCIVVILDTQTPDAKQLKHAVLTIREQLLEAGIVVLNANLFQTHFLAQRNKICAMRFHENWHRYSKSEDWVQKQNLWQTLHNVEDHRKNLVVDAGAWALMTSHNFMDVSCFWHENAFVFDGLAALQLWDIITNALLLALEIPQKISEEHRRSLQRLATMRNSKRIGYQNLPFAQTLFLRAEQQGVSDLNLSFSRAKIRVLDTYDIQPCLLDRIDRAQIGDTVLVATAYFSDPVLWQALLRAVQRGVYVKVLIDNMWGLPLPWYWRVLFRRFVNRSFCEWARDQPQVDVRIFDSANHRMMHLKTAAFLGSQSVVIGGQANYTPRSFSGAWFESDVEIEDVDLTKQFYDHFQMLWNSSQAKPISRRTIWNRISGAFSLIILKVLFWIGVEI